MKRALIVGINDYVTKPLKGCVADAKKMLDVLAKHADGSNNFECHLLTSEQGNVVTRTQLLGELRGLLETDADHALFYFSGHGGKHKLGGYLVTQEATTASDGFSFQDLHTLIMQSPVKEITIILDCCYSGKAGDDVLSNTSELREGVTIMSASRPEELAAEDAYGGIFTSLVVDALRGEAADILGRITLASIYGYVDDLLSAWDQRPLFKTYASRLKPLRMAKPKIEIEILRRLTQYFPSIDHEYRLSPSYVPSAGEGNIPLQTIYKELQKMRAIELVEPLSPHDHMYYAAMGSSRCRLTARGRQYWRMVDRDMI